MSRLPEPFTNVGAPDRFPWKIAVFYSACCGALMGLIAWVIMSIVGDAAVTFMSPCQCRMAGGCSVEWSIDEYADGTRPEDYDEWDQYIGDDPRVPEQCRPQF